MLFLRPAVSGPKCGGKDAVFFQAQSARSEVSADLLERAESISISACLLGSYDTLLRVSKSALSSSMDRIGLLSCSRV